jgi:integrase
MRDRLLLKMDMTEALRPSELFALRWRSFDDVDTLTITETVYKGEIRRFGKTDGSLTDVHRPSGLAEELRLWKEESAKASKKGVVARDAFIFPNTRGGFLDTGNYRNRVLNPLPETLGLPKLNFPGDAPHDGHAGADYGIGEGHSVAPAARTGRYHSQRVHAGTARERQKNGRIGLHDADERRRVTEVFRGFATNASKGLAVSD